ncbi:MAG: hypothetical protein JSW03_02190 [Candidatus Eiseniibacteriota bacterium]|nr:MAG: hypothetical protein JSW03_02190 [Candidatus Eisenbacteria bacterium]
MASATDDVMRFLKNRGWAGRIVGVKRLHELREAIEARRDRSLFDEDFYQEQLRGFTFQPPELLPGVRSIIIIAVPVPQTRAIFHTNGGPLPAVLPPTYAGYSATTDKVRAALGDFLASKGHRVAKTVLPLKTLAVGSALADYGRNNICYVNGMGSFLQLVGCYSDLPCPGGSWREATMLERCKSCSACELRCPTEAIRQDRFLLRAERCLTFHNERPGEFPDWIDPSAHNCLIGCMHCQSVCPENKSHLAWMEDRCEFSMEETALMLKRVALDQLPPVMKEKLRSLELNEAFENLCRNLSALVGAESKTRPPRA